MTIQTHKPDTSRTYSFPSVGSSLDMSESPYHPGQVVRDAEKAYKFVLAEDLALVVGWLVCYTTDDNGYEVTGDRADGTSDNLQPAGLVVTAIPDGDWGLIQIRGLSEQDIITDGSVAAGEEVKAHATTNGGGDTADDVSSENFGQALDDDTGSVLAAGLLRLQCPDYDPALDAAIANP